MQNTVLNALKERRSIRKFKTEQVNMELLSAVLEAGTYAPTAANCQSPIIVAVQNSEDVATLNRLNSQIQKDQGYPNPQKAPYYGAPTILLVLASEDTPTPTEDACLVAGNLLNAAFAVGLGSCWIHRSKEMFDLPEGKELLKKWGLSDQLRGVSSIALGYPDCDHPAAAKRKENYSIIV